MKTTSVKWLAKQFCPPALWEVARRVLRPNAPTAPIFTPYRFVHTLQEVDQLLQESRLALENSSTDTHFALLDSFHYAPPDLKLPADPDSPEYRQAQMNLYLHVSGRADYSANECEQLEFSEDHRKRPFPYYTRSCTVIGEQLQAIGFIIKALKLPARGRILEFGAGYGRLTSEMVRSDYDVTAVDINPSYVDLIRHQCRREEFPVDVVCSGMLNYRPAKKFDRVIFYESFHHCEDHNAMIARLDDLVAKDGCVLFAGEPIVDSFPMPWGVRLDGRSVWAIRLNGWLELGFQTGYFINALARQGWKTEILASKDIPWQRIFVARRAGETN